MRSRRSSPGASGEPAAATSAASRAFGPRRLAAQGIRDSGAGAASSADPAEAVARLGAVQAQDFLASKWAVGLRTPGATAETIEHAIRVGTILRTHLLRGTWQLVAPADVRWMLALVAPRIIRGNARRYRELGLDAAALAKGNAALEKALRKSDRPLTRDELGAALERAGVSAAGQRLPYLLQRAELDGLLCGGARRGKEITWALLDECVARVGYGRATSRELPPDEAAAALAERYFQSRGPATVDDFVWWSGLATVDARRAHEAIRSRLLAEVADGKTYWAAPASAAARTEGAHLLPAFDEILVGYRDRSAVLDPALAKRVNANGGMLAPVIVVAGRVIGTWRRMLRSRSVDIQLAPFGDKLPRGAKPTLDAAVERYAAFLALDVGALTVG